MNLRFELLGNGKHESNDRLFKKEESPPPSPINGMEFLLEDSFYDSEKDLAYSPSNQSSDNLEGSCTKSLKITHKESQSIKKEQVLQVQDLEVNKRYQNFSDEIDVDIHDINKISLDNVNVNNHNYIPAVEVNCEINQIEKMDTSTAPSTSSASKQTRLKNYCYFCENLVLNFSRHLVTAHPLEIEVQEILSKPTKSRERKELIGLIRKKGNYLNSQVHFKPMKKTNIPCDQDNYIPCEFCLGIYVSRQLWRHKKVCQKRLNKSKTIKSQLLFKLGVDNELQSKVFPTMRLDNVSILAKKDTLICAFGSRYLKTHREQHFINITSRKMRELAKILIEVRKIEPTIQTLFDALNPKFYDYLVTATKIIAKYDSTKKIFQSPTFAMNISTTLKQCCDIAITYALKKKGVYANVATAEVEADLKTMIQLLQSNWKFDISTEASNHLNMQNGTRLPLFPLAKDLKLLKDYLTKQAEITTKKLKSDLNDKNSYKILLETIFCRLILLNRKRPGELQRLFLDTYLNSEKDKQQNYEEFSEALLPSEKLLMKRFKRIVIRGKRDRGVPVLISPDVQEQIKIILNARNNFISQQNRYFFASVKNNDKPIIGYKVLSNYALACKAENPKALTSTRLRKHMATLTQLFEMKESDLEQLSTFMGHTSEVHKKSYRLPDDVYQTAKITKILLLMEKGQAAKFKGKSLEEIEVDMEEELFTSENTSEEVDEAEELRDLHRSPESTPEPSTSTCDRKKGKTYKRIKRERWTEQQKRTVTEHFQLHITNKKAPKEKECTQLLRKYSDLLHNKDWQKIKVFIQNAYSKKK
ncbi:unnamed protein product [Diabrotica balteata]|uniref:Uncharacterized protein n=1 Tax=Diabrotica balteata TaxID=107213 RepID=A0A9N9X6T1_DIABA|nr:unnamed protein product [Diabrotica balteata]